MKCCWEFDFIDYVSKNDFILILTVFKSLIAKENE